ncbi:MAG: hypothetical protein F2839_06195, partial [Actinobacteria bacterium]|nr:hypothetical protein [Actinomycetota bacterium]
MWKLRLALVHLRVSSSSLRVLIVTQSIAVCALIMLLSNVTQMKHDSVFQAVTQLPLSRQFVSVSFDGERSQIPQVQAIAQESVTALSQSTKLNQSVAFKATWNGAATNIQLLAHTQLEQTSTLKSGRWPQRCDAILCEVVATSSQVANDEIALLGLSLVGVIDLSEKTPLRSAINPDVTLVISSDPQSTFQLPSFAAVPLTVFWDTPTNAREIARNPTSGFLAKSALIRTQLALTNPRLLLKAPDSEVAQALTTAQFSSRRIYSVIIIVMLAALFMTFQLASMRSIAFGTITQGIKQFGASVKDQQQLLL